MRLPAWIVLSCLLGASPVSAAADLGDELIFDDGFEEGSTCLWSGSSPWVCGPTLPISFSELGRTLTVNGVYLDDAPATMTSVPAGSSVTVRVTGGWVSDGGLCPSCTTQFYARMHDVFSLCLGSGTGAVAFDESDVFNVPATPGTYYINPAWTWDFVCDSSTTASTEFSSRTFAVIVAY